MCLIADTCKRLKCEPKDIFNKATEKMGFTNADECARYRLERWWKYGEIPIYVQSYCNTAVPVRQVMTVHLFEGAEPVAYDEHGDQIYGDVTMLPDMRESTGIDPHRAA